jgi:hypothetical protein
MELTWIENVVEKMIRQSVENPVNIARDVGDELDKDLTSCHRKKL